MMPIALPPALANLFADPASLRLLLGLAVALALSLLLAWRLAARGRREEAGLRHEAQRSLAATEARLAAQDDRLGSLTEERDGLTDALHGARETAAGLERRLAEAQLAARKDAEAAAAQIAQLTALREEMSNRFQALSADTLRRQTEDTRRVQTEALSALLTPLRDQVHRFQTELQTRERQAGEERARLEAQINFLHQRSEDISREAVALTRALKGDSRRQGAWGEMILARLLEDSGLEAGAHYLLQQAAWGEDGKLWRPDCIVRMPQQKVLVIDSKVSLLAYEEWVNAEDEAVRAAALRRHLESLRAHVKGLAARAYQTLDEGSVDYVLMFIPIEGAFSDALRADPDLARLAMEQRVGLTTPTTLMLALRTVDHIWTVERRERNAAEIARRAGQLYDKVAGFVSSMEAVGAALDKAQGAHRQAVDRLARGPGNVIRQVEMLRELGAKTTRRLELSHDGDEDGA